MDATNKRHKKICHRLRRLTFPASIVLQNNILSTKNPNNIIVELAIIQGDVPRG